jgi:hypothetical protein
MIFLLGGLGRCPRGLTRTRRLDVTAQAGTIVDSNARRDDTALHAARRTELNAIRRFEIPQNRSVNDDLTGFEVSLNAAVGSNGKAARTNADFALNVAIDIHIGASRDFSTDFQACTDS